MKQFEIENKNELFEMLILSSLKQRHLQNEKKTAFWVVNK